MAPSHFNSQPWRFVLVDDRQTIDEVARISGESMTRLLEEGTFWKRYRPYFRFSEEEMEEKRDGIHFDQMPGVLKPFRRQIFSSTGQAVMLDRTEYRPGQLSGFYSVFGMGAAVENVWLTTAAIGMGIQFVSTPMEIPENWQKLRRLLKVPDDLELMAVYRLGYVPQEQRRPTIDWSSRQRKRISQYVFRNTCEQPEPDATRETGPDTS